MVRLHTPHANPLLFYAWMQVLVWCLGADRFCVWCCFPLRTLPLPSAKKSRNPPSPIVRQRSRSICFRAEHILFPPKCATCHRLDGMRACDVPSPDPRLLWVSTHKNIIRSSRPPLPSIDRTHSVVVEEPAEHVDAAVRGRLAASRVAEVPLSYVQDRCGYVADRHTGVCTCCSF